MNPSMPHNSFLQYLVHFFRAHGVPSFWFRLTMQLRPVR